MLKKIFTLSGLFFVCLLSAAAQKLELSLQGGVQQSWIPDYSERAPLQLCSPTNGFCTTRATADVDLAYKEKPGVYLKGLLAYLANERLQLYHSLGLNLLRFQPAANLRMNSTDQVQGIETGGVGVVIGDGRPAGYFYQDAYVNGCKDADGNEITCEERQLVIFSDERLRKTSVLYLSQELGATYKILPRISMQGGIDVSYRVYSQVYVAQLNTLPASTANGFTPYPSSWSVEKDKSGRGFNGVLLGLHLGAAYELLPQLSISLALQHSLTPVYDAETVAANKARASLLRLGVQYKLRSW